LLVINQVNLIWKVKNEGLRPYHKKARALVLKLSNWSAGHIPREENARADDLSNDAMDTRGCDSTMVIPRLSAAAAPTAASAVSCLDLTGDDDDDDDDDVTVPSPVSASAASAVAPSSSSSSSQQAPAVSTDTGSDALVTLVVKLMPTPPAGIVRWDAFTGATNIMVIRSTDPDNVVRLELPCVAKTHATPAACVDYIVGGREGFMPRARSSSLALSLPHVGCVTLITAANDAATTAHDADDDAVAARFSPAELAVRQAISAAHATAFPSGSMELVSVPAHKLSEFIQDTILSTHGPCRVSMALQSFAAAAAMLGRT
jgi:hypothetical protein